jgi:serine/threonine protein kinase
MPVPATIDEFLSILGQASLVEAKAIRDYVEGLRSAGTLPAEPKELARVMVRDGLLTLFQAQQVIQGKTRGYAISGKYKLLEHLGEGGMGSVYLCEHISMRRRVAIKILPVAKAEDVSYLERFYREARAVAALDHPNIVRAHDIDRDGKLHFLVMEYVDGSSFQQIVKKAGPMDVVRACHYIAQTALGLQAAHEAGLVHRDVKPGNILVDRNGVVKILDMGLARFFNDDDSLSKKYEETVLGTTDYLAPEQAVDSNVDIRADVYSLGATFYFLLTGRTLFGEGMAAQKLIWHQTRQPKPIRSFRPEVPEELADLIELRMLAKDREERFQIPAEVAEALGAWTKTPISLPPAEEMPRLCPAAAGATSAPITPGPTTMKTGWTVPAGPSGPRLSQAPTIIRKRTVGNLSAETPVSPGPITAKQHSASRPPQTPPVGPRPGASKGDPPVARATRQPPKPHSGVKKETPLPPPKSLNIKELFRDRRLAARAAAVALGLVVICGSIWWAVAKPRGVEGGGGRAQAPLAAGRPGGPPPSVSQQEPVTPPAGAPYRFQLPSYEAVVEADGCLTSLRVGGTELLWVGGRTSRGCYFFQNNHRLSLPAVERRSAEMVSARGEAAGVRYTFSPDGLTWTLTNTSNAPLIYFIVFGEAVKAVSNDNGEWAAAPAARDWPTTTWYAGPSRLALTGGNKIWGPWEENTQVWEADLAPGEQRQVVLKIGPASQAEAAHAAAVSSGTPVADADLLVQSPRDYQVFQRYSRLRGQAVLQGRVKPYCTRLEARLSGQSLSGPLPDKWQDVDLNSENRSFDTTIPLPAGGWYRLELRALRDQEVMASAVVEHVGVGEVFVAAGQSNATNCGEQRQKVQSGFVSTFDGSRWRIADDPQPGVHDKTGGGSCWPAFGDALHGRYGVPIAIASTGHNGSSVSQWQKGGPYYQWLSKRIEQLGPGGFRAVLWHQGETDVRMSPEQYAQLLQSLIENSKKDAGWDFPWFVAQVSYLNPREPSSPTTRAGQKKVWEAKVALEGPDTDALTGDNRDDGGKGIHFSGKGLRAHGRLWADKVASYLDKVLEAH